jgi:hypothetical protein
MFSVKESPALRTSPVCLEVLKPEAVASSVKLPVGSRENENSPVEPEVLVREIPFSESVSFTVAFGTLAPDGSVTVPDNAAVELNVCAWSVETNVGPGLMAAIKTARSTKRNLVMLPPEGSSY